MGTEAYIEIVHTKERQDDAEATLAKIVELCFEKVSIFNRSIPRSNCVF